MKYEIRFVCVGLFAYIFFPFFVISAPQSIRMCVCVWPDDLFFFYFLLIWRNQQKQADKKKRIETSSSSSVTFLLLSHFSLKRNRHTGQDIFRKKKISNSSLNGIFLFILVCRVFDTHRRVKETSAFFWFFFFPLSNLFVWFSWPRRILPLHPDAIQF
jgi:hypothetical protein